MRLSHQRVVGKLWGSNRNHEHDSGLKTEMKCCTIKGLYEWEFYAGIVSHSIWSNNFLHVFSSRLNTHLLTPHPRRMHWEKIKTCNSQTNLPYIGFHYQMKLWFEFTWNNVGSGLNQAFARDIWVHSLTLLFTICDHCHVNQTPSLNLCQLQNVNVTYNSRLG